MTKEDIIEDKGTEDIPLSGEEPHKRVYTKGSGDHINKRHENETKAEPKSVDNALGELPLKDPLKDRKRMSRLKSFISHLSLLALVLAVKNIFLAIFAHFLYENKSHSVVFGAICLLQLISAPIGLYAIRLGNRLLLLICVLLNVVFIISTLVLLLYYWLFAPFSQSFNNEISLHVGAIFILLSSLLLTIGCIALMRRLHMINLGYSKPKVFVASDLQTL